MRKSTSLSGREEKLSSSHHHHNNNGEKAHKVMKIVGILLIKLCVLLDPKGALLPYPLFASMYVY